MAIGIRSAHYNSSALTCRREDIRKWLDWAFAVHHFGLFYCQSFTHSHRSTTAFLGPSINSNHHLGHGHRLTSGLSTRPRIYVELHMPCKKRISSAHLRIFRVLVVAVATPWCIPTPGSSPRSQPPRHRRPHSRKRQPSGGITHILEATHAQSMRPHDSPSIRRATTAVPQPVDMCFFLLSCPSRHFQSRCGPSSEMHQHHQATVASGPASGALERWEYSVDRHAPNSASRAGRPRPGPTAPPRLVYWKLGGSVGVNASRRTSERRVAGATTGLGRWT